MNPETSGETTTDRRGVIEKADGTKYLERRRANAFLGLVRAGDNVVRSLDKSLRERSGLGLHQFEVLLFLSVFAKDRTMRMSELRRHAPLSQSRVSRVVAELESEGLVARNPDPDDSRAVLVSILNEGIESFKAAQDRHLADLDELLFERITEDEIDQLGAICEKLLGRPVTEPESDDLRCD